MKPKEIKLKDMKFKEIRISDRNTRCGLDYFVPFGLTKKKREWIKEHELYEATINSYLRIVTPVYIKTDDDKTPYMMDVITGTLYDIKTGRCQTSSDLHMQGFVPKGGLETKLLKMRVDGK